MSLKLASTTSVLLSPASFCSTFSVKSLAGKKCRASDSFTGGYSGAPLYPPVNESEARHFFPAKDFTLKVEQKDAGESKTLVVEASFKDINRLLASPYARAHQLALTTNQNGTLWLQALSGGSALALAAQMKPGEEMGMMEMPGLEDAQRSEE